MVVKASLFSQLLDMIPRNKFAKIVEEGGGLDVLSGIRHLSGFLQPGLR